MKIVDANIILRYLLDDHKVLSDKATEIIEDNLIHIPFEVVCEIVYVLQKVYNIPKLEIKNELLKFFQNENISTTNFQVLAEALTIYAEKKLDFVDTLLVAYHLVDKNIIFSFDKKLNRLL